MWVDVDDQPTIATSQRFRRVLAPATIVLATLGATVWFEPNAKPALAAPACTLDRAKRTTIDPQPFLTNAYGVRWNFANDRLVFMQPATGGHYRLFTVRPDGSERKELTDPHNGLPPGHRGAPVWHPSGRYVLFVAQKRDWSGRKLFGIPDYEALPGFGRHDDLWLITADGSQSWKLSDDPDTRDQGILIPVFSPDGKRIAWSARQPVGTYILKVAHFAERPEPHLEDIKSYEPGGRAYYEPGSFTSDSASLLYTSDQDSKSFWRSQIYRLDLSTGKTTRLTPGNWYNEHPAVVAAPSGDWVVYMSTKSVERFPFRIMLGTDWYAMRTDGSDEKRLTLMNINRKDNPENAGFMQVAGRITVSPSGDFMLGDVQDSLVKQSGLVRKVRFVCE